MRQVLKVQISENKEYLIDISDCSFAKFNQEIFEYTRGQKRLVIMSQKVYKLYSGEFKKVIEKLKQSTDNHIFYILNENNLKGIGDKNKLIKEIIKTIDLGRIKENLKYIDEINNLLEESTENELKYIAESNNLSLLDDKSSLN